MGSFWGRGSECSIGPRCINWKVLIHWSVDTHISENDMNGKIIDGKMIKKSVFQKFLYGT